MQTVLARAYGRWHRLRDDAPDAYLRAMLATTYLSWSRRRWRGELPTRDLPEAAADDDYGPVELRQVFNAALAELTHRQRAVLMLRYHADLTEESTARALGISVGTVKSCTSRALARLRVDPQLRDLIGEGIHP